MHHFKWRAGVELAVANRLRHYKGEDEPCAGDGQPRFKFWRESERLLNALAEKNGVDVKNPFLKCKEAENPETLPLTVLDAARLLQVRQLAAQQIGGQEHSESAPAARVAQQ